MGSNSFWNTLFLGFTDIVNPFQCNIVAFFDVVSFARFLLCFYKCYLVLDYELRKIFMARSFKPRLFLLSFEISFVVFSFGSLVSIS